MASRTDRLLDWLSSRLNLTEIFSLLTSYGLFYAELDNRKPLRRALREALARPTLSYSRWPRVLGLMVVVLIAVEVVTGGLLALYYLPTPEAAHASLGTISRDVQFGWLMHQIHFWGAQVLIAVLLVRVLRFFVGGVYRAPRELVWVFAVLLLLVCFHLDLTGRALPMTAAAYWSTVRALEIVAAVPIYGSLLLFLLGGDPALVSDLALIRLYVLHVAVLPVAAVALIYLHFSSVRRLGLSVAGKEEPRVVGAGALKTHLANLAIVLTLLFGVVVTLAVLAPVHLQAQADPFATVPGVGPPWYLLAPFGFLEATAGFLPRGLAGLVLFLLFSALVALPFLWRGRAAGRPLVSWVTGALVVALWLALTFYGRGQA